VSDPFSLLFSIAHVSFVTKDGERDQHIYHEVFILWNEMDGWANSFCATSSVEVDMCGWSVCDLDYKSMKSFSQMSQTI
jgi:hypothetical protein